MSAFCPKCGKEIAEGGRFCSACGTSANGSAVADPPHLAELRSAESEEDAIRCPRCGSRNVAAMKEGYSGQKACLGVMCYGPIGLLSGQAGANKIFISCLKCGHQWRASSPGGSGKNNWALILLIIVGAIIFLSVISSAFRGS